MSVILQIKQHDKHTSFGQDLRPEYIDTMDKSYESYTPAIKGRKAFVWYLGLKVKRLGGDLQYSFCLVGATKVKIGKSVFSRGFQIFNEIPKTYG